MMGFRFFRRINLFPGVSINLGKRGASLSVGPRGMKTTIGKRGIKQSIGIPGTGIRWETPYKKFGEDKGGGCPVGRAPSCGYKSPVPGQSTVKEAKYRTPSGVPSDINEIIRRCEFAMQIDLVLKVAFWTSVSLMLVALLVYIFGSCSCTPICVSTILLVVSVLSWSIGRKCLSVSLSGVNPAKRDVVQSAQLGDAFGSAEVVETCWPLRIGSNRDYSTIPKSRAFVLYKTGFPFKTTSGFKTYCFAASRWLMTDWGAIIIRGGKAVAMPYAGIEIEAKKVVLYKQGCVPSDVQVVRTNWLHETKSGAPDRRYGYNPCNMLCNYGIVHITAGKNKGIDTALLISRTNGTALFPERQVTVQHNSSNQEGGGDMVDESYFNAIYKASSDLVSYIVSLNSSRKVRKILNDIAGLEALDKGQSLCRYNARLTILVYNDLRKVFERLGHSISRLDTYEGVGLMMVVSQLFKVAVEMSQFKDPDFCIQLSRNMASVISSANESFTVENIPVPLIFHYAMNRDEADREVALRYATLVYRWASLIAKVDGTISASESECLSEIAKLYGSEGCVFEKDASETEVDDKGSSKIEDGEGGSDPIGDLDSLIGLAPVKMEVRKLASFIEIQNQRQSKGLKIAPTSYHCVFTGNPGTGKTTVARIVARIYKELGVLKKGHLVETDRAGLVGEYVGQTAVKTNKIIDSALDGVLFVDEAYSLIGGGENDYGREAIATLLKRMEDDRKRLVVILAGYTDDMKEFIESNPGLRSRFNRYIEFPDYSSEELIEIFKSNLSKNEYILDPSAEDELVEVINNAIACKDRTFGNARYIRNLFERVIERQALRLSGVAPLTQKMLQTIEEADFQ